MKHPNTNPAVTMVEDGIFTPREVVMRIEAVEMPRKKVRLREEEAVLRRGIIILRGAIRNKRIFSWNIIYLMVEITPPFLYAAVCRD